MKKLQPGLAHCTHLTKMVCLILSLAFVTACGDEDDDNSTSDQQAIMQLGAHESTMTENAMTDQFAVSTAQAPEQSAIVIAGKHVSKIVDDDDHRTTIASFLTNSKPVVLINASSDQAKTLADALDVDSNEPDDGQLAWRALMVGENNKAIWTEHRALFNGGKNQQQEMYFSSIDGDIQQQMFTNSMSALDDYIASPLPDRLNESVTASKSATAVYANQGELDEAAMESVFIAKSTTSDASDDITDIESAQSVQTVWDVYLDDSSLKNCSETGSDCDSYTSTYDYARYTITSYIYTFYDADSETDYYYMIVDGNLAQGGLYTEDSDTEQGIYTRYYGIYNVLAENSSAGTTACEVWSAGDSMDDLLSVCDDVDCDSSSYPIVSQSDGLELLASSPSTQTDCTTTSYTSSVSYTVTGSISTLSTGLQSAVDISNSTTYSSEDVCQYNYSGETVYNETVFIDDITAPTVNEGWFCYESVDTASGSATSTFSPTKMWIWSTDSDVRDDTNGDELVLCTALYYGAEEVEISDKNCFFGAYYSDKSTSSYWGYVYSNYTFDMIDIDD